MIQSTHHETDIPQIDNNEANLNLTTAIVDKYSSASKQKHVSKLSRKKMQLLLLSALIVIILLTIMISGGFVKLNKALQTKDRALVAVQRSFNTSLEDNQMLTNQMKYFRQKLSMLNTLM
jgi:cell division protein FtsB